MDDPDPNILWSQIREDGRTVPADRPVVPGGEDAPSARMPMCHLVVESDEAVDESRRRMHGAAVQPTPIRGAEPDDAAAEEGRREPSAPSGSIRVRTADGPASTSTDCI